VARSASPSGGIGGRDATRAASRIADIRKAAGSETDDVLRGSAKPYERASTPEAAAQEKASSREALG
jgi:hypothetical protein